MKRLATLLVLSMLTLSCDSAADKGADQTHSTGAPDTEPEPEPEPEPAPAPKVDPELHDAFDKLCNAAARSGADALTDPNERIMKTVEWIKAEVHHEDALKLFSSLATMDPTRRSQALEDAAKKAGVAPCPMADET